MNLTAHGEANEVGAETEASALAGRNADGWGEHIQDGEDRGGEEGKGGNLVEGQSLARDEERRRRDGETLN